MEAEGAVASTSDVRGTMAEVDEQELHFLILHFLSQGPCRTAAEALMAEAAANGLLPTRTDIFGKEHAMGYRELAGAYSHIPPTLLPRLMSKALQGKRSSSGLLQGLGSLLSKGIGSMVEVGNMGIIHRPLGLPGQLAERQVLGGRKVGVALERAGPRLQITKLGHMKTIRGHRLPIYCLAFDHTGHFLISGSDDRIVKIWSMRTGLLQMSCLGHEGEVTDLAVCRDNSMVASSSNDTTVRVWSLESDSLGYPISVLQGHTAPISFISFHRHSPHMLLSSSLDGTCRIWDAHAGGTALHTLATGPSFGPSHQLPRGLPVTTRHAQAAARVDGEAPPAAEAAANENEHPELLVCAFSPDGGYVMAGANDCHCYVWAWGEGEGADWTAAEAPTELCRLAGHKNDILLLQFSHDCGAFGTGSRDGTLRIWRRPKRRGQALRGVWQAELTLASSLDEAVIAEARRRRRPPPSPSITQLCWTKDDSKVLAAVTDHSILVWDAGSGEQLTRLVGHTKPVHVLEGHPSMHGFAMSASYDGQIIVWDLDAAIQLSSFTTRDTRPGGGTWPDALQLMDGHWTVDGCGIVVSDSAGQVHIYGTGPSLYTRARYDQYTLGETRPLSRDVSGFVIYTDSQQPPHLAFHMDSLCDFTGDVYPEDYQAAWRGCKVSALSVAQAQANMNGSMPNGVPPAVYQFPPVLSAAAWAAQEEGGDESAIQAAVGRALLRLQQADLAASQPPEPPPPPEPAAAAPVEEPLEASEPPEEVEPVGVATRRARLRHPHDQLHRRAGGGSSSDGDEFGEVFGTDAVSRAERLEMRTRRREELMEREMRGSRRRRAPKRRAEHGEEEDGREQRLRRRSRATGLEDADASVDEDDFDSESSEDEELEEESDGGEGPSLRPRRATAHYGGPRTTASRAERAARRAEASQHEERREAARRAGPLTRTRPDASARGRGRPGKAYAWLQECRRMPGVYVPQLEDEVVYIWVGHAQYMQNTHDKRGAPWTSLVPNAADGAAAGMRPAEPCRVVGLEYRISDDGQANTVAWLRLQGTDPESPLFDREFELEIPPSHLGQAEFVIERSRFDISASRDFGAGQRCKIFYPEEGDGGQWWHGRIVEDWLPEESRVTASERPFDNALWERYTVEWDGQATEEGGGQTEHAAWEMFDEDDSAEQAASEGRALEASQIQLALTAIDACLEKPVFAFFAAAPEPDENFPTSDGRGKLYYNQVVELPMSLLIIQARLQNGYYRRMAGLRHDLQLLANNATSFNGEGSYIARLAQRAVDEILATIEGRELPPAEDLEMEELEEEEEELPAVPTRRSRRQRAASSARSSLERGTPDDYGGSGSRLRPRGRRSFRIDYAQLETPEEDEVLGDSLPLHGGRRSSRLRPSAAAHDGRRRSSRRVNYAELEDPGDEEDDSEGDGGGRRFSRRHRDLSHHPEQQGRVTRERRRVERYSPDPAEQRPPRRMSHRWAPKDDFGNSGEGEADEPIRLRLRPHRPPVERFSPGSESASGEEPEEEQRVAKRRRVEESNEPGAASNGRIRLRLRLGGRGGHASDEGQPGSSAFEDHDQKDSFCAADVPTRSRTGRPLRVPQPLEPDGHDDGLLRSSRPRRAARERSRRLSDNVKSEEEDWRAFSPGPGLRRRSKPNYRELDDDDDELWED